jgi:hypothetical protein
MIDLILIPFDIALATIAAYTIRWALRQHRETGEALKELEVIQRESQRLWIEAMYAMLPPETTYTTLAEALLPELPEPL